MTPKEHSMLQLSLKQPFGNPLASLGQNSPSAQAQPVRGAGGGLGDLVHAVGPNGPARLAEGEFVWPADVVSFIGNGSTEAGGRILKRAMEEIRMKMKRGGSKQSGHFHEVMKKP